MNGRRFASLLIAAALLTAGAGIARAQTADEAPSARRAAPHAKVNRHSLRRAPKADRAKRMDALYKALAEAPNAEIAKLLDNKIEGMRQESGSPTADLLMMRFRLSAAAKDNRLAFELLDAVLEVAPDFVEARAQRATLYYETKDIAGSLADLRVIVAKDPRHYGALTGLGVIFQELGEDKLALDAFRRALKLNPFLESVPEIVRKLTVKVEGRDI